MPHTVDSTTSTLTSKLPFRPSLWESRFGWLLLLVLAIGWSLGQAGLGHRDLINQGGWTLVAHFLVASLNPKLTPDFLWLTTEATLVTLAYAVCGTALSLLVGLTLALPTSELFWYSLLGRHPASRWLYHGCWLMMRLLLALPRGIHELLWGLFFVNIFGLDPLTAVLAITIPFGAIVAKIFSEIIDDTPPAAFTSLLNSGVQPVIAFLYAIIPLAFPNLLSYAFYRLECAIRAAAILGVIGAGGLGYQILLSVQTLKYEELWTLFYALFLLSGLVDLWSGWLRHQLGNPPNVHTTIAGQSVATQPAIVSRGGIASPAIVRYSLLIALLLWPSSWWYIQPDISKLWSPRTARLVNDIVSAAYPPRGDLTELFYLTGQTFAMSLLATLFASLGGLLLAFPAAHNFLLPGGLLDVGGPSRQRWLIGWLIWGLARGLLLICRAIPAPIWALIMLFVFFPGILPGAIALGVYNLGIVGRLVAEVIENLDQRPLRALKAQGATGWQIFLYGVLPMTMPRFLAYSLYRWEICIRATVIVGLVGAGGLGRLLTEQLSNFDYRSLVMTLIFYIGLTFVVDVISALVRRGLR